MSEYQPQDSGENSLWGSNSIADPSAGSLQASLQADVLVVGGGYTGLSSALHLAEQGVSVVLLEAATIGFGGSGRNAGLVNAGVWQNPAQVVSELGQLAGERFNLALRDSPSLVFDLVERYRMDCDARRCGTVNIAHKSAAMKYLEDRCHQLQQLGSPVELIDGVRAEGISASPVYRHGGILDPAAGTIHPLNYARSLALAAIEQGAQLFRDSPIRSLTRQQERWLAKTSTGQVSAEQVILATNAYADENSQGVRESTLPVFIFHCATAPLAEDLAASIIPERQGLWDTNTMLTSSRVDSSGRLVMSSPGRLTGWQRGPRRDWMKRLRDHLYPQTRGLPWEYFWTGQIGVTSSKILRVQLLAPGVYAPAGYNGRGIGPGTVMGQQLANTLLSGNRDDFPFPIQALYREKWRALRAAYIDCGTLAWQIFDKRW